MPTPAKRATVYFDPSIHKALKLKSIETSRSISDLVNEAVKAALAEDAEDIAAFEAYWPLGTKERVWFAVLLHTGLRRGDQFFRNAQKAEKRWQDMRFFSKNRFGRNSKRSQKTF